MWNKISVSTSMSLYMQGLNSEGFIFWVVQYEIICALPSLNKSFDVHTICYNIPEILKNSCIFSKWLNRVLSTKGYKACWYLEILFYTHCLCLSVSLCLSVCLSLSGFGYFINFPSGICYTILESAMHDVLTSTTNNK